jgi:1-acyl-sn-glycerol-3-phosphate acyltransferase
MLQRGLQVLALFASAALLWWRNPACRQTPPLLHDRALWLQHHAGKLLKILGTTVEWHGPRPDSGLLIGNHLGYLDILALSSQSPMTFVAKKDILHWPVIGQLVNMAGTIWVERTRRHTVGNVVDSMQQALASGQLVTLFPEGTSSDGTRILPFKPSLLQTATHLQHVWIAHLRYELTDGDPGTEVAYWGNAAFFPHLLNLFKKKSIKAIVRCEQIHVTTNNRKLLARNLHQAVTQLGTPLHKPLKVKAQPAHDSCPAS